MDHVALDNVPPLPADRTVGIGGIGAGFIMADCHLVAYRDAGLNPVAIAARRPDAAAAVAAPLDALAGAARLGDALDHKLLTMAVVDAACRSAREHRSVEVAAITTTALPSPQEPPA